MYIKQHSNKTRLSSPKQLLSESTCNRCGSGSDSGHFHIGQLGTLSILVLICNNLHSIAYVDYMLYTCLQIYDMLKKNYNGKASSCQTCMSFLSSV